MREKVGKSRNTVFFQWLIWGSGGSKSRLAKAVGAEPAGQMRDEKLHAVVARAHFQVKMYKAHHCRTTFGSWDVEKVHAIVARSTFPSENVQNTPFSDHFWQLRCRKSACCCDAKHISKWKCTKHYMFAPLLEVQMSKKVHAVVVRTTFRSKRVQNTRGSDHFWRLRCRFASLHHHTTLHNTTTTITQLHNYTTTQLHNYTTTLHYTKLHSTTLHYTTLNYTPLHYTTFHYTSLHYITLHSTTTTTTTTQVHSTTLHYTKLQYTTLYYTTLHSTTLHYTTLHYFPLHFATWH